MDKNTKIAIILYGSLGAVLLGLSVWSWVEYTGGNTNKTFGDVFGPLIAAILFLAFFAFLIWYVKRK